MNLRTLTLGALACVVSSSAFAAAFTPGNLVVLRVGDGSAALAGPSTAAFLDEYTTTGTLVQSIAIPTTGPEAITLSGSATTEGVLGTFQNGQRLVFTGYRNDVGAATASSPRVIATVDASGTIQTVVTTDVTAGSPRSAASVDGSTYYYISSTGVRYIGDPITGVTTLLDTRNSRQGQLINDILYVSNGSTAVTSKLQNYGVLPTTAMVPTPMVQLASGDAVHGWVLADLDPNIAGVDTAYVLSTVASQLIKFTFDGSFWNNTGSVAASGPAQNLTASISGNTVTLYATTNNSLRTITDSTGYGGTLSGDLTTIAPAATNTAFRGIAFVPASGTPSLPGDIDHDGDVDIDDYDLLAFAYGTFTGDPAFNPDADLDNDGDVDIDDYDILANNYGRFAQ